MILEETQNGSIFEETPELPLRKTWRHWLIGRPLATADAPHQTIGKLIGLAVFSSDALSSVAYGPQGQSAGWNQWYFWSSLFLKKIVESGFAA